MDVIESHAPNEASGSGAPAAASKSVPRERPRVNNRPKRSESARAIDSLLAMTSVVKSFRAADGRFHVRVPVGVRHEIFALKSTAFRDWLIDGFVRAHQTLPPQRAVTRVIEAIEARSRFEAQMSPVYVRVGRDNDERGSTYFLDLADSTGAAIQISAAGWSVVQNPDVHFKRPPGLLPLPVPNHDGSIELLAPFVNLDASAFRLLIGWMAMALRPSGPFPLLLVHGEQGSSKSTLAKLIRDVIDPQTPPLLAEPTSNRDLMVTAVNGWLLVFDNVSALPAWLSDSFCRLATGGGLATRALFSDEGCHSMQAQRPLILNGIDEFVRKGDLADRGAFLHLPAIGKGKRRDEQEFWRSFREVQPRILGGLLDAVVGALRELPSVKLADLPRMADFAIFGEAMARGLGWPAGSFLSVYHENRRDAISASLEDSALATLLLSHFDDPIVPVDWKASPAKFLHELRSTTRSRSVLARLPKTPGVLSNELRRLAPQLREQGVLVSFSRSHAGRQISVTKSRREKKPHDIQA